MKSTIPCRIRLHMIGVVLLLMAQSIFGFESAWAAGKDLVYIGTYTDHGSKGIYVYRFDEATGQATSLGLAAESPQPSFLTVDPIEHFLYAVNELDTYKGQHTGAVSSFSIDAAKSHIPLRHPNAAALLSGWDGARSSRLLASPSSPLQEWGRACLSYQALRRSLMLALSLSARLSRARLSSLMSFFQRSARQRRKAGSCCAFPTAGLTGPGSMICKD